MVEAANCLMSNCSLYRDEGIVFVNINWLFRGQWMATDHKVYLEISILKNWYALEYFFLSSRKLMWTTVMFVNQNWECQIDELQCVLKILLGKLYTALSKCRTIETRGNVRQINMSWWGISIYKCVKRFTSIFWER